MTETERCWKVCQQNGQKSPEVTGNTRRKVAETIIADAHWHGYMITNNRNGKSGEPLPQITFVCQSIK
jgi:type III secretion system FlhB-like substrate exporter